MDYRFGSLDIVVNNAGIVMRAKVEDMQIDDWRSIIDVNLTGRSRLITHLKRASLCLRNHALPSGRNMEFG